MTNRTTARATAAWLENQRELLSQLSREQDPVRLRAELEKWWNEAGAHAPADGQELAAKLLDLGQSYLHGLQQFARAAAASHEKPERAVGESARESFTFGPELMAGWRAARLTSDFAGFGMAGRAAALAWLQTLSAMSPAAPEREFILAARAITAAHAECLRLEAMMSEILQGVQNAALEALQQRVTDRIARGQPVRDFSELYELWTQCGEAACAQTMHGDEFARLQAELTNALMRLRKLQQQLVERMLRKLDLPTRSEVNSLHMQMRELRRKLNEVAATAAVHDAAAGAGRKRGAAENRSSAQSKSRPSKANTR